MRMGTGALFLAYSLGLLDDAEHDRRFAEAQRVYYDAAEVRQMDDAVFKGGRRRGFTTVYREVAQDRRLSLKARGCSAAPEPAGDVVHHLPACHPGRNW